jgi:hypothetical protein
LFILDNHIDFLRMIEICPLVALQQLNMGENDGGGDGDGGENDGENDGENNGDSVVNNRNDINEYFIFIHYLQNYSIYNRLIFIGFSIYGLFYFLFCIYYLFYTK